MVHKSDLVSALSAARASNDAADAKAKEMEWQLEQLNKTRDQLHAARQEVLQLQTTMSEMVSRAELNDLKATATIDQQKAELELRQRISSLESEKIGLERQLQVCHSTYLFLCFPAWHFFICRGSLTCQGCCADQIQAMVPRKDLSDARFVHLAIAQSSSGIKFYCTQRK